eukprot:FR739786.1.p1 GENE.FR739786.1~~FR739786.1.p1  ORF type:complete len:216 (-),score=19.13 FR739786.1:356-1003(-)
MITGQLRIFRKILYCVGGSFEQVGISGQVKKSGPGSRGEGFSPAGENALFCGFEMLYVSVVGPFLGCCVFVAVIIKSHILSLCACRPPRMLGQSGAVKPAPPNAQFVPASPLQGDGIDKLDIQFLRTLAVTPKFSEFDRNGDESISREECTAYVTQRTEKHKAAIHAQFEQFLVENPDQFDKAEDTRDQVTRFPHMQCLSSCTRSTSYMKTRALK